MDALVILIPLALFISSLALVAFFWAVKSGQFDDFQGAAERILYTDDHPEHSEPPPSGESKP